MCECTTLMGQTFVYLCFCYYYYYYYYLSFGAFVIWLGNRKSIWTVKSSAIAILKSLLFRSVQTFCNSREMGRLNKN